MSVSEKTLEMSYTEAEFRKTLLGNVKFVILVSIFILKNKLCIWL